MDRKLKKQAGKIINSLLRKFNYELVGKGREFKNYIQFRDTIRGANKAGLSVGDYIDAKYNVPGATQKTIDKMTELGVFSTNIKRVCEIGPGSGRYLNKTFQACTPDYYEIYETADEWSEWLIQHYKIIAHESDGESLSQTPSRSMDLVQSHKVYPGLPILTILGYFNEMARVCRKGGKVVFDIFTEGCLDEAMLRKCFLTSGPGYLGSMVPKKYAIDFFSKQGCSLVGTFFIPMLPVITEYLVFIKN